MTPRLRHTSVTVTAPDPRALAEFYARLLDRPVGLMEGPRDGEPPEAGFAQIKGADGQPTLNFEFEEHWTAPTWPAQAGHPHATQHLDIRVGGEPPDLEAAVQHAVSVGAVLADLQPQDDVRVLFDPAGHPFCLFG